MFSSWLLRGVVMTAVHVAARVVLGLAIIHAPLHSTVWKTIAVAVVVLVSLLWGGIDGIADARANPDPDDYEDLTVRWLKAGVFAGVVAGLISWILGSFVFAGIGQASLCRTDRRWLVHRAADLCPRVRRRGGGSLADAPRSAQELP